MLFSLRDRRNWILMFIVALVIIPGAFAIQKYEDVQELERRILLISDRQLKIVRSIDNFYQHSGYGGFIHHFKNYVLRQEESYLINARIDLRRTLNSLEILQQVAASYEIGISLEELQETLNQYGQMLLEAETLVEQGNSPEEIDNAVSVSDFAAIYELTLTVQTLSRYLDNELALLSDDLGASKSNFNTLMLVFIFSTLISITTSIRMYFLSEQKIQLKKTAAQDHQKLLMAEEAERLGKIGHWFLDNTTDTVWWSEGVFNIHERDRSLGMPTQKEIADYYHPDDKPIIKSRVEKAVKNGEFFEFTKRIFMNDGRIKIVRVTGETKKIGGTDTVFGVIRDITAETKSVRENKALLERINLARQILLMGIWDIDLFTQEMSWDDAMHELFGIHKGEFHGQLNDWVSRIHPEDLESTRGRFMAAIEKGEAFEAQYRIIGADQNVKWLDSRAHVVRNRLGVPISLLGITTDITLSKEAEAKIEKALDEAKRANEAKSEFLAVMSHEIRTPLSGLIGILEILQEKRLEREAKDLVATALSSSSHLLTVLSDVLEFSRIEAGKLDIVEAPFSLNLMLKQIVALHFSSAKNKELELLLVKPEEDYVCIGDEQRIRQIIGNYLGNAIKFTENGKIKLECDADLDVSSKVLSTKIIVHDNGIGIPKDRLASLFTPFEQVDSSRTRSFGGTGLGLSICKKLAEQMGGQVGVESVEGEGSSFYVKLDLPIGTLEDTYQNIKQSIKELPRLKILAAEDVALNQFILKTMVGDKMKQDLTVVTNGLEVLECLQSSEFDVVLMDVQMPEMDGVTATETIRQSAEEYNDIPIIGLTANALESQQKEYISAGMSACISKPLNWEELTNVLSELVVK